MTHPTLLGKIWDENQKSQNGNEEVRNPGRQGRRRPAEACPGPSFSQFSKSAQFSQFHNFYVDRKRSVAQNEVDLGFSKSSPDIFRVISAQSKISI